jgi:hypothetical protein
VGVEAKEDEYLLGRDSLSVNESLAELGYCAGFGVVVWEDKQSYLSWWPPVLWMCPFVESSWVEAGYKFSDSQDVLVTAFALGKGTVGRTGVLLWEVADSIRVGLSESVDALVIIAGDIQLTPSYGERSYDLKVAPVEVLILIDQEMFGGDFELEVGQLFGAAVSQFCSSIAK